MNTNVSIGTIARTACLALALTNTAALIGDQHMKQAKGK